MLAPHVHGRLLSSRPLLQRELLLRRGLFGPLMRHRHLPQQVLGRRNLRRLCVRVRRGLLRARLFTPQLSGLASMPRARELPERDVSLRRWLARRLLRRPAVPPPMLRPRRVCRGDGDVRVRAWLDGSRLQASVHFLTPPTPNPPPPFPLMAQPPLSAHATAPLCVVHLRRLYSSISQYSTPQSPNQPARVPSRVRGARELPERHVLLRSWIQWRRLHRRRLPQRLLGARRVRELCMRLPARVPRPRLLVAELPPRLLFTGRVAAGAVLQRHMPLPPRLLGRGLLQQLLPQRLLRPRQMRERCLPV